ncbi:MAG: hypothetical protein ABMA26_00260 [Limisphaerales bacterium]
MARHSKSSAGPAWHRLTAAVLATMMAWLGWFVRSETAHDHLHFHPVAKSQLIANGKLSAAHSLGFTTQTPRWLKVGPAPERSTPPAPTGPHHHRSLAFDSLAAGLWCGLFTPAALPVLDLPVVTGMVQPPLVAPLRTQWLLLPGRAPPVCT